MTQQSQMLPAPVAVSSQRLWAAYRRQGRAEDQAWQRYRELSDRCREAFVAWSLAKHSAERAYVAYRRAQEIERSRHAPRSGA